jgi:hypothetical protein
MITRTLIPAALAAVALAGTACGGGQTASSSGGGGAGASASLRIVARSGFTAIPYVHRWRLTCNPDGGNLPHPASACAALARQPHLLDPLPHCAKAIPDIGSIRMTGVYAGRPVDLSFSCPQGGLRWDKLAAALRLSMPKPG